MNNNFKHINETPAWIKLHNHYRQTRNIHMRDLFLKDKLRFKKMHEELHELLFDYSKNRITERTLTLLIDLANEANLKTWIHKMFGGDKINISESRAVLHTALRRNHTDEFILDGKNIILDINKELEKAFLFADKISDGSYRGFSGKKIKNIVNIGIGGSDLGPKLLSSALKYYCNPDINLFFIANIDLEDINGILTKINPEETLFIVASKSFTTPETLLNAKEAKSWFLTKTNNAPIDKHFVAISANFEEVSKFGIGENNYFKIFDWVGGRYSCWSSISLSVIIAIGKKHFLDFLNGARVMDEHFINTPFRHNIPVLLGMISLWYNTFYRVSNYAIIPYSHALRKLPPYIQQLDMESNGKQTNRYGEYLDFDTGAVIWGEEGVNCQHAFFQLLHQGSRLIPSDFILIAKNHYNSDNNQHDSLVANAFAQSRALMQGKLIEETIEELSYLPDIERDKLVPQKNFPGNQPTNIVLLKELSPFNLGMLLAMYEHKVFVQGIIWGINSFDQWGVEYGKILAKDIEEKIKTNNNLNYDSSTNALIKKYVKYKS